MRTLILFISICIAGITYSQNPVISNELRIEFDKILKNPSLMPKYILPSNYAFKQVALPCDFAEGYFNDPDQLHELASAQIKYVTYVYTHFCESPDFDQEALNKERLFALYRGLPQIFEDSAITWRSVKQFGATTQQEAGEMFHGFVIQYKPAPTEESMLVEIDYLSELLSPSVTVVDTETTHEIVAWYPDGKTVVAELRIESYVYDHPIEDSPSGSLMISCGSSYKRNSQFTDTAVSAVLNRNSHWNKMLIHCDLTGSMSPYSAQLFLWHKLNFDKKKAQHFVFFNDGDHTPDGKKISGQTGGIYHSTPKNFDELMDVAYTCMRSGWGGDAPENDVEAILEGIEECPECNDIVLIADNWANMRDYKLLDKIERPVKIILCGAQYGINVQYLNLAKATGGSIHTMEEDILDLMKMKDGDEIKIGHQTFIIRNGEFTLR